jgi:transposase
MDCGPDGKAFRRLNAMHLLLLGAPYDVVLRNSRCSERAMRLWISRFNQLGIDGLIYRPRPGRPRLLENDAVRSEILPLVDDPSLAGQLHWTAVKLTGWLRQEKGLEISYRTLVRYLHEHNYARRIPRPVPEPPDRDIWLRQRQDCARRLQSLLEDPAAVVFFGDEAGFEGDPRPRHKWVKRGSRPTQGYYGGHLRRNVVGAVEPATGRLVSLIVAHCNTGVFQVFLDTMAREIPPEDGKQVHLVLDNAAWHKSAALNWHHIKPFYLSPYSPDFNPIERLWQHLKGNPMTGYLTNDGEALTNRLLQSLQGVLHDSKLVRSICSLPSLNR